MISWRMRSSVLGLDVGLVVCVGVCRCVLWCVCVCTQMNGYYNCIQYERLQKKKRLSSRTPAWNRPVGVRFLALIKQNPLAVSPQAAPTCGNSGSRPRLWGRPWARPGFGGLLGLASRVLLYWQYRGGGLSPSRPSFFRKKICGKNKIYLPSRKHFPYHVLFKLFRENLICCRISRSRHLSPFRSTGWWQS